jgi:hypothetical protein
MAQCVTQIGSDQCGGVFQIPICGPEPSVEAWRKESTILKLQGPEEIFGRNGHGTMCDPNWVGSV